MTFLTSLQPTCGPNDISQKIIGLPVEFVFVMRQDYHNKNMTLESIRVVVYHQFTIKVATMGSDNLKFISNGIYYQL